MAADPQQAARSAAMQDEMQALASKLLDLWQDHVSALAQDPALMAQALKLMAEKGIGALVVLEAGQVVGILSISSCSQTRVWEQDVKFSLWFTLF